MQYYYKKYPQSDILKHRVHAAIAVVGDEWKTAESEKRAPDLRRMTVKLMDKTCDATAAKYPHWPKDLYMKDLSEYAAEQYHSMQWWLPDNDSDGSYLAPLSTLV
jgi:hypothetical protein